MTEYTARVSVKTCTVAGSEQHLRQLDQLRHFKKSGINSAAGSVKARSFDLLLSSCTVNRIFPRLDGSQQSWINGSICSS
jgi:hypothetical protein